MTAELDKLADDAAAAVIDVIEEERRINRSDIAAAIKRTIKPLLEKPTMYGGFGVGAFTLVDTLHDVRLPAGSLKPLGDGVHVYRNAQMRMVDPPLLPDED